MKNEMRRKDRQVTERCDIERIVSSAKILHLALIDGDYPYIVPLHYGYEYAECDDRYIFYMHGAKIGHKLDVIAENSNACVELETDVELDPAGDIACKYGSFYSSLIGRGKATLVTDVNDKIHGLKLLMKNQTGKDFEFTEQMAAAVAVIRVDVSDYSAKARRK